MNITDAQKKVDELIMKYGGYWEPLSMMARITEEVGELARALNITHGGKERKDADDGRDIEKELADVLFTTLAIANREKVDLESAFLEKVGVDKEKLKGIYYDDDTDTE